MKKGIFITGTDTGVGKTYVACSIARTLNKHGISTGAIKPVASGDRDDARKLRAAAGLREPLSLINPVCLKYPLAPLVSARLSGKKIDMRLVWKSYRYMKSKYDFNIVEGVGGLMVPVKKGYTVLDMIKDFSLPVLVVARPSLGTINHTLLTVDKLKKNRVRIAAVLLSGCRKSTLAEKTNPGLLRELTGLEVIELGYNGEIRMEQCAWLL